MSKITDEDVIASVLAYGKASSSGCRSEQLSVAGMRAAAEEIERRVLERVKVESKPMHEPVSEDEAMAMIDVIHYGKADSFFERVRSAGNALLARRAAAELKSMHEPVTADEADRFRYDFNRHQEATGHDFLARRLALEDFLARRAAATRVEVVVTEEMIDRCLADWERAVEARSAGPIVPFCLNWLRDELNRKHAAPVDPRVEIVRDWAQSYSIEPEDESIAELIAKLDARKP